MARNSVLIDIYLRLSIAKESKQLVSALKLLMGNCKIKIQAIPILKWCIWQNDKVSFYKWKLECKFINHTCFITWFQAKLGLYFFYIKAFYKLD
jgi:hypothetical protein